MQAAQYDQGGGNLIRELKKRLSKIRTNFFIALGLGIIIGASLMRLVYSGDMAYNIEEEARKKGMIYPEEIRVLEAGDKE